MGSNAVITRQQKGLMHEMEKLLVMRFDDEIQKQIMTRTVFFFFSFF